MHDYTQLKIDEFRDLQFPETQKKWRQTAESMNARGMYFSSAHLSKFVEIGELYIKELLAAIFQAEKYTLLAETFNPSDDYYLLLNSKTCEIIRAEYDRIHEQAMKLAHSMSEPNKQAFSARITDCAAVIQDNIVRQIKLLQQEIRLQKNHAQYSSSTSVVTNTENELKGATSHYDIVLSFAGEERAYAERLAELAKTDGFAVFYDRDQEDALWGSNLYEQLTEIYSKKGRYCVMFLSRHYAAKQWPTVERRAAQERAFKENQAYILPIRIDDTSIPGVLDTVGYQDLREKSIEEIYAILKKKLQRNESSDVSLKLAQEEEKRSIGVSPDASRLLKLISDKSEKALTNDPMLTAEEAMQALELRDTQLGMAADELDETGLVVLHKAVSMGKAGFRSISPSESFFARTDSYFRAWNTEQDSVELAKTLIVLAGDGTGASIQKADEQLQWGPRRINPALYLLIEKDLVLPSKAINPDYVSLHVSLKTRIYRYVQ